MNNLTENQHVSLESLRGIAAITVAVAHVVQFFIVRFYPEAFICIIFAAQSSVMVFFSMSGFLIGKSIQSNSHKNGSFMLSVYAESRFKRIYPPLILSIALIVVLNYISPYVFEATNSLLSSSDNINMAGRFDYTPSQILSALTFTNGISAPIIQFNQPLWSLPLEVWYYAIAGLLFTRKPLTVITALIIFACISSFKFEFFVYSSVWFSGLLASYIPAAKGRCKIVAYFVLLSLACASLKLGFLFAGKDVILAYYNATFGLFFTAFIYVFLVTHNKRVSILNNTSGYSYTLYITHYPILYFFLGMFEMKVNGDLFISILVGLTAIFSALVFASYSSRFVENRRFINSIM
ncbi:acyltransferase [Enterobacter cloacae]|uniref:acyltransferase family protein n=1 Tax=Enterobacter cloacae TaxID=550 RepID=UPI00200337F6|nr:acyltransferase [Enterobacter cloacae]MCK7317166.1 acyltransferase [Enterobacter cloacae]